MLRSLQACPLRGSQKSAVILLAFSLQIFIPPHSQANPCAQSFELSGQEVGWVRENPDTVRDSMGSILTSAAIWLTGMQAMRSVDMHTGHFEFERDVFVVTLGADMLLTVMSHYASLLPGVSRALKGGMGKYDLAARSAVLIPMGTAAIVSSWYLAGTQLNAQNIGLAAGLCTAVYPPLIMIKKALHRRLPELISSLSIKQFLRLHPSTTIDELFLKLQNSLIESGMAVKEAEQGMGLALEWVLVGGSPIEHKLRELEHTDFYNAHQHWVKKIDAAPSEVVKRRLRLGLTDALVRELQTSKDLGPYIQVLDLGHGLSGRDSLAIHRWLATKKTKQKWVQRGASFADQAIAVGFAGGVLLYSLNEYVLHTAGM